jgi:hypothetical protein
VVFSGIFLHQYLSLSSFNSEDLTSRRDNPAIDSAPTSGRITPARWLFHGATLSVHILCDLC